MSRVERFFTARSAYRIIKALEWDDDVLYKDGTFEHEWWMRCETWLGLHRQSRWDGWLYFIRAIPLARQGNAKELFMQALELFRKNATQLLGFWEELFSFVRTRTGGKSLIAGGWVPTPGTEGSVEAELARAAGVELLSLAAEIKERILNG